MMRRFLLVAAACIVVLALSSCDILIGPSSSVASPSTLTTPISPATSPTPTFSTKPPATQPALQHGPLVEYVLDLINKDRADYEYAPVTLGANQAAQKHAEDMLAGFFLSHWGTDGLKPYMRYTLEGGVNYDMENSSYTGWYDKSENPDRYAALDVKQELQQLEYAMMYDDAGSDWGHRDNILNKWHKKVNIGIAYDGHRLAFVEDFEGDYVQFNQAPALLQGTLSISGRVVLGVIDAVAIYYDPVPHAWTQQELLNGPHSYSLGDRVEYVVSPPPPGYFYTNLPPDAIQAGVWNVSSAGDFSIKADLNAVLKRGPGVYTVAIWSKAGTELLSLTNYSIFLD